MNYHYEDDVSVVADDYTTSDLFHPYMTFGYSLFLIPILL